MQTVEEKIWNCYSLNLAGYLNGPFVLSYSLAFTWRDLERRFGLRLGPVDTVEMGLTLPRRQVTNTVERTSQKPARLLSRMTSLRRFPTTGESGDTVDNDTPAAGPVIGLLTPRAALLISVPQLVCKLASSQRGCLWPVKHVYV